MKNSFSIPRDRAKTILETKGPEIIVIGDFILDHFIWGKVSRISPEAPVPVVDVVRESFMPGGAANVACNLAALGKPTVVLGSIGKDDAGRRLRDLLEMNGVNCDYLNHSYDYITIVKTRIVANQQQLVRVDREPPPSDSNKAEKSILNTIREKFSRTRSIIIGDYGKGAVNQVLLDGLKAFCQPMGIWISLDPKPVHRVDISGLSLLTPNRKEAFELAGLHDPGSFLSPLEDKALMEVAKRLMRKLNPNVLLITLGDKGMLVCQRKTKPIHIPTIALEVFDVSGAGDTVIASYTLAIEAGASPLEAAIFANHAAGIVVGKIGTATCNTQELLATFDDKKIS